jgi:hypothetical protein
MDLDSALEGKPAEGTSATDILRADHREVERLFAQYEDAEGDAQSRLVLMRTLCMQLELHDRLEREVFYPAAGQLVPDAVAVAAREHDEIMQVVSSLRERSTCDRDCDRALANLRTLVDRHVHEEETELFARLEKQGPDLCALGEKLVRHKEAATRSTESFEGPAT